MVRRHRRGDRRRPCHPCAAALVAAAQGRCDVPAGPGPTPRRGRHGGAAIRTIRPTAGSPCSRLRVLAGSYARDTDRSAGGHHRRPEGHHAASRAGPAPDRRAARRRDPGRHAEAEAAAGGPAPQGRSQRRPQGRQAIGCNENSDGAQDARSEIGRPPCRRPSAKPAVDPDARPRPRSTDSPRRPRHPRRRSRLRRPKPRSPSHPTETPPPTPATADAVTSGD